MFNDPSLYNNLNRTSSEINLLMQDIRLNPKRYFTVLKKKSKEYVLPEDDQQTESYRRKKERIK